MLLYFPLPPLHAFVGSPALFRIAAAPGELALTFDDGPDPGRTPKVLSLLRRHRMHATFFVVGRKAARHPDLVWQMLDEGHAVGSHTWSHRWLVRAADGEIAEEIDRCAEVLARLCGGAPRLIRPPYGWGDARFYDAVRARRLLPVLWSCDSFDYLGAPALAVERRLRRAQEGDIVLLHEGTPRARGTVPALERWLERAARTGLRSRSLAREAEVTA